MNAERTTLALAVVLVGAAMLSRKAGAAETIDDVIREITVTARRIGEGGAAAVFGPDNRALGLRSNNPMNIRETAASWVGELPHDGDGYENFDTAANGIRAGARVLVNYWRRHELNTVRGVITRWAPHADNNPTEAYVEFAAKRIGVAPDAPLDMVDVETLTAFCDAIIAFENGEQPFTKSFIRANVRRAL